MTIISVISLSGFISYSVHSQENVGQSHEEHLPDLKTSPANSIDKGIEMKMDSKDMNGMALDGKDGVMNKAEMSKMNKLMKDCMKIHNDSKMCNINLMKKEIIKKN